MVDFMSKQWTCPFCQSRNVFPPHYAEHITETHLPAELLPHLTTVEYQLPGTCGFLFVTAVALVTMPAARYALQRRQGNGRCFIQCSLLRRSGWLLAVLALVCVGGGVLLHVHTLRVCCLLSPAFSTHK
ncbi:MAG: Sec23/Sec24 zinc finger-containing protein [Methanobacteriota archaeon]|nr:MAG: Sec23/Sec24 zinc finger-containing protein [Euryarchaeota archaeon]